LIPFEDLSLHVLELEQVLACEEEGDEELDWAMNPIRQGNVFNVDEYNNAEIRRCYSCQSPGHIQRYCPSARRYGNKRCYECQSPYHLWRDCPNIDPRDFEDSDSDREYYGPDDERNRKQIGRTDRERKQIGRGLETGWFGGDKIRCIAQFT
jgi:hypothetical protein